MFQPAQCNCIAIRRQKQRQSFKQGMQHDPTPCRITHFRVRRRAGFIIIQPQSRRSQGFGRACFWRGGDGGPIWQGSMPPLTGLMGVLRGLFLRFRFDQHPIICVCLRAATVDQGAAELLIPNAVTQRLIALALVQRASCEQIFLGPRHRDIKQPPMLLQVARILILGKGY